MTALVLHGSDQAAADRLRRQDALIEALLVQVPWSGWTRSAVHAALAATGGDPEDAALLLPSRPAALVAAYSDYADRRMIAEPQEATRLSARVQALIVTRLRQQHPHQQAVRRGLAVLAGDPAGAAACTARTIDAMWHAAGDHAADFSWYTKRATLAAVFSATLLFWLQDDSTDDAPTLAFLDRRLAGLGRIGHWRRRLASMLPGRRATDPGSTRP